MSYGQDKVTTLFARLLMRYVVILDAMEDGVLGQNLDRVARWDGYRKEAK